MSKNVDAKDKDFFSKIRKAKGITLVALIVTIIILLILAGITIAQLTGSGLFEKAQLAKEKQENAQIEEKDILDDYEKIISSVRETTKSQYINSVDFYVYTEMNEIKIEINIDIKDESKLLGYHYFVKNVNNNEIIKSGMTTNNIVKVDDLDESTKYDIYVTAYDIEDNCIKANTQRITTLDEPVLSITDIAKIYYYNTHGSNMTITPDGLYNVLFNGNTNEGGKWVGVLLNPVLTDTSIKFTVNAKIKLYAYGHKYSDSYGSSGADIIIQKYNELANTYEDYKTVPTKTDGKRYELLDLDRGQYNMKPAGKYVNFDEWEYELIK